MWFFPWLSYLTIAVMAVVVVAMAFLPDTSSQFWFSLLTLAVVLIASEVRRQRGADHASSDAGSPVTG
jgi:L-asparagine transporter-like permease